MAAPIGDPNVSAVEYMVTYLNSNFDDNIRSLSRLQTVCKDVKEQKANIEAKVMY